ncbi:DUF1471 domain-containing protein [Candidatus Sodalis endolongispinus]|uniref:DUF1471 domain-containing protein n=1 Tax=Candidatus Sodalis endolongispinus TaxID=2812662 RepID=A0ABS5YBT5_9GAMM|nr:DUF1471 domain-containing protein [Candidatus Sodalis endolongispinus]MBT9432488.1 DUF1471 domain-containing protein [Candidatus Sodalis endolongispinus]
MKNVTFAIAAILLSTLSFASLAAQEVQQAPADQQKVGVVSATVNNSNLSQLQSELAAQADASGAKSYQITSASGENNLHGTAVIYQ